MCVGVSRMRTQTHAQNLAAAEARVEGARTQAAAEAEAREAAREEKAHAAMMALAAKVRRA